MGEGVREGQGAELLHRGIDEALLAEAESRAPQPREPFQVLIAFVVPDVNALAAGENRRPAFFVEREVGVGMHGIGHVSGGKGVRGVGHDRSSIYSYGILL